MKLDELKGGTVNFGEGPSDTFGFGMADPGMIFKILRERMYSNPRKAAIQEYMCNARDAHREAKIEDRPIQITFPDYDGSEISIRDFGFGIPKEMMAKVFTQYGASTKRGTDRFTGGWGLGCKTGFAIGDNFRVTSITNDEDGVRRKREYLAYIDETVAGSMSLIAEEETEEETGLEVSLPISSYAANEFGGYVELTARHWKVRPQVLNKTISWTVYDFTVRGESWGLLSSGSRSLIILDGIEYILRKDAFDTDEFNKDQSMMWNKAFVLYANTGDLKPTPSREDFTYDDDAKHFVLSRLDIITKEVFTAMRTRFRSVFFDDTSKMDPFTLRDKYANGYRNEFSEYLEDELKEQTFLPLYINASEFGFYCARVKVGYNRVNGVHVPDPASRIYDFPFDPKYTYVLDDSNSSKTPRGRLMGLIEEDGLDQGDHIIVVRWGKDSVKMIEEKYPKVLEKLFKTKPLSEYRALRTQEDNYRAPVRRKGSIAGVRQLTQMPSGDETLYSRFEAVKHKNGVEKDISEVGAGVFLALRAGGVYVCNRNQIPPKRERVQRVKDEFGVGKKKADYEDRQYISSEDCGLAKVDTKTLEMIHKAGVPIYAIFEKNIVNSFSRLDWLSPDEWLSVRHARLTRKHEPNLIGTTRSIVQSVQSSKARNYAKFFAYWHDLPIDRSPDRKFYEWRKARLQFATKTGSGISEHNNIARRLGRQEFSVDTIEFDWEYLDDDERIYWVETILEIGSVSKAQTDELIAMLKTNQFKNKHETA